VRLFVRRVLGEDVSALDFDLLLGKYEEARIMREFEVGVVQRNQLKDYVSSGIVQSSVF
jgi:hypothetical protein